MKIKKGDKVQVIAGNDKGTIAEVIAAFPKSNKVVVEGVNIAKKHQKPNNENPDGGIISKEVPINVSNVMLYDSKEKKPSKVAYKIEKGKKTRIYAKSKNAVKGDKK